MKNTNTACDEDKTSENMKADSLLDTESINTKFQEVSDIFNKLSAITEEVGQWSKSTGQLFYMEVLRNIYTARQLFLCQLLFIPLLVLFVFSLCILVGVIAYTISLSILVGFICFLLTTFLVLIGLIFWQKHLMSFLGFKETIDQLKEGVDVISKASK